MLINSEGIGDDMLRWNGLKAMVDGSLGSRTAWMHNHYLDEKNSKGFLIIKDTTQFKKLILEEGKLVATVRLPRGDDVLAACGQLKSF